MTTGLSITEGEYRDHKLKSVVEASQEDNDPYLGGTSARDSHLLFFTLRNMKKETRTTKEISTDL